MTIVWNYDLLTYLCYLFDHLVLNDIHTKVGQDTKCGNRLNVAEAPSIQGWRNSSVSASLSSRIIVLIASFIRAHSVVISMYSACADV